MVTRHARSTKTAKGRQQQLKPTPGKQAGTRHIVGKPAPVLISEKFPKVSGIVLYMTYYQEGINPILMFRTVNIFPKDPAVFSMGCMMKGCMDGGFNLARTIVDMIKRRKMSGKGEMVCKGKRDNRAPCRARISYDVKITYRK